MPEQNTPKKNFKWMLAAAVFGIAIGCAIGSVAQSFVREPFAVDAVDSTFQHLGGHTCSIAMGISLPGVRSAAYGVAIGAYRLVQGTRFALSAKKFLARRGAF